MAVDRADDDVDAEAHRRQESPPPPDRPGAEDVPSRADSRQGASAANEKSSDVAMPSAEEPAAGDETGEAPRPYAERLDVPIDDDQPTPREVLERFSPTDAGLPEVTEAEAAEYIEQNANERPWLAPAKDCDPCVQRVLVAMDQGQGHALERHEGFADDEKLQRRVTALEDPAQLDDEKRVAGIDGCKPGNKAHKCGDTATAIQDPNAFATAFARGVEHPSVQRALRTPWDSLEVPDNVSLPIEEILGSDGRRYCSGYRIEPVGGSRKAAQDRRSAWVAAQRTPERDADVPVPKSSPIEDFTGASVDYFFRPNREKDGYEIATMYVQPPRDSSREGS